MLSAGTSATVENPTMGQTPGNSVAPSVPATATTTLVPKENHLPTEPEVRQAAARGSAVMEFAVLGLLLAGAVGILKAIQMDNPLDVLLCLLGSTSGCGLVCWVYFRRD